MEKADEVLLEFFGGAVQRAFDPIVGLRDGDIQIYVAALLAEFHARSGLWNLQGPDGKDLVRIGELLVEADPVRGNAPSFDREREVRKHIGDYALFFTGVFPGGPTPARGRLASYPKDLTGIVEAGKESYLAVALFDRYVHPAEAPLFFKLSQRFELCAAGLHRVARECALA